jgi:GTP-binding protein
MEVKKARFLVSNADASKCPAPDKPEYAFTGRSNVGKSSLLNMLVQNKSLAKTSGNPGKTRLINHFLINDAWYLADLPGYGYARVSKQERKKFDQLIRQYIVTRENLYCLFLLIDIRHEPQKIDLEFIHWLGMSRIPFAMVFTKADKLKPQEAEEKVNRYTQKLSETWEEVPPWFLSSATQGLGRTEILAFIQQINESAK